MKKTLFIFTALLLIFSLNAISKQAIKFNNPSEQLAEYFISNNYDVAVYIPGNFLSLVVTESQIRDLRDLGYDFEVYITEDQMKTNMKTRTDRDLEGYRTYEILLSELQMLELIYPDICKLYDIGDTWGSEYSQEDILFWDNFNHDVWALKVSDNPTEEEDEPSVYYLGVHHAREPISLEVVMYTLNHILANYGSDDEITNNINSNQIWFVPLVNPNGHKIVTDEYDIWWRKNIRDNNDNDIFDSDFQTGLGDDGVDPNRNYEFCWGFNGATDDISQQTYHGPHGFSEPESFAIGQLMEQHHFVTGLSYHSHGQVIFMPDGGWAGQLSPDIEALADLANNMALSIGTMEGDDTYHAFGFGNINGMTSDHAYGKHGIFSYCVELANEFIPPAEEVLGICEENLNGALVLLNRTNQSILTGHITDAETGNPLSAQIVVHGIDDQMTFRNPYISNETFGSYWRLLLPQTCDVTYQQYGYLSQTFEDIVITNDGQTIQDVALEAAPEATLTFVVKDFVTDQPIEDVEIEVLNTPLDIFLSDEYGLTEIRDTYLGEYEVFIEAEGYSVDIKNIVVSEPETILEIRLQQPEVQFGFEAVSLDWTFEGDWGISDTYAFTGDFSLTDSPEGDYQTNINNSCILNPVFDYTNINLAYVTFALRFNLQPGLDFCDFEISTNSGNTWNTIDSYSGNLDEWVEVGYDLSEYEGSQFSLRFRIYTNHSFNNDGIYIDDFALHLVEDYDITDNADEVINANKLILGQNYPNPFNLSQTDGLRKGEDNLTSISYDLPASANVTLNIYNIKGQKVKNLVNSRQEKGLKTATWNGRDENNNKVSSGVYFYRLEAGNVNEIKKMIILR